MELQDLPKDCIQMIMGHLPFNSFLSMRLVCRKWNKAGINCNSQWSGRLFRTGKKKIGPDSVHSVKRKCKRAQLCRISQHFNNLVPKYDPKDETRAYWICNEMFGERCYRYIMYKKGLIDQEVGDSSASFMLKKRQIEQEVEEINNAYYNRFVFKKQKK